MSEAKTAVERLRSTRNRATARRRPTTRRHTKTSDFAPTYPKWGTKFAEKARFLAQV